jgi:hypothetical protein
MWGVLIRYASTPLIVALSPGNKEITRFRPCSPIVNRNLLDRAEKIQKFTQTTGTVDVFIRVQVFREPLRGELGLVRIFAKYGSNALTLDVQLLSY